MSDVLGRSVCHNSSMPSSSSSLLEPNSAACAAVVGLDGLAGCAPGAVGAGACANRSTAPPGLAPTPQAVTVRAGRY
eukprot:COSAG02_NODE_4689_length_5091_cov_1.795072_7_plen_77_part_00